MSDHNLGRTPAVGILEEPMTYELWVLLGAVLLGLVHRTTLRFRQALGKMFVLLVVIDGKPSLANFPHSLFVLQHLI